MAQLSGALHLNAELEGLAKLLYDYWFVQYDFPLSRAQAALRKPHLTGKPYRSSGGPMVYNEQLKREIPKGWEVGSLLDIAKFTNGIACQKYPPTTEEFFRVIKIKEMRDGFTDSSEKVTTDVPEKIIGMRHGEKIYETLLTREEMLRAKDMGDYYRVPLDERDLNYATYFTEGDVKEAKVEDYTSHNTEQLNVKQVEELLLSLSEVQAELKDWNKK